MTTDRAGLRRGFTLPEATLALVILGMAAAGVLLPFAGGAAVQAEGMHRTLAAKLANDLMERIVATHPRDAIASWDGYAEAEGQVEDVNGVVFADPMYAGFRREASCETVEVLNQTVKFFLITVRVSWQGRQIVALTGLINK